MVKLYSMWVADDQYNPAAPNFSEHDVLFGGFWLEHDEVISNEKQKLRLNSLGNLEMEWNGRVIWQSGAC